jgi:aminopeptidase-like protein
VIDSDLHDGSLSIGVLDLPVAGRSDAPLVLFSTNTCHPSLAVNELSGIVVLAALAEYVRDLETRRFAYRFLFVPETIGTLAYLALPGVLGELRQHLVAGFVVSCVPEPPELRSTTRSGRTFADNIAVLPTISVRHGDDRQYAHAGVDLPVVGIYAREPGSYAEYHTSRDDLSLFSESDFTRAIDWFKALVDRIERSRRLIATTIGEPHLARHGLYPDTSEAALDVLDLLDRCDGQHDLAGEWPRIAPLVSAGVVREIH